MTSPQIANSWFLTGPTAAGKSAVGVELARRIGAEIISMDSMALYRGMDIGTAKPTHQQRESIPHHLIDVIEPCDEFSLAQYLEAAGREAAAIAGRGRQVLFVGGTPLYLKGLLRGIFQGPPADWPLRRRLAARGPAARALVAPRPPDRGRSGRRRKIAPQRCPPAGAGPGSVREDRPTDQPIAAAVRRWPIRPTVPRVRARLAPGGAARPDRPPRVRNVRRRPGGTRSEAFWRQAPSPKRRRAMSPVPSPK